MRRKYRSNDTSGQKSCCCQLLHQMHKIWIFWKNKNVSNFWEDEMLSVLVRVFSFLQKLECIYYIYAKETWGLNWNRPYLTQTRNAMIVCVSTYIQKFRLVSSSWGKKWTYLANFGHIFRSFSFNLDIYSRPARVLNCIYNKLHHWKR